MKHGPHLHNPVVAAILALIAAVTVAAAPLPAPAQQPPALHMASNGAIDVESLLDELARPDQQRWRRIERQIMREWSRSGSAAVDYLFQRGQQALRAGQPRAAIDHFSAAIDHDPDFAEAWHARASAWFMDNRYGLSMADLEQALARNPRHFGAMAGLGAILEQVGELERAREAYGAAHALNPHRQSVREALERLDLALAGRAL